MISLFIWINDRFLYSFGQSHALIYSRIYLLQQILPVQVVVSVLEPSEVQPHRTIPPVLQEIYRQVLCLPHI